MPRKLENMDISNNLSTIDSVILGNYIVKHYGPMSHLKLQKLLFYCDAYHLAYFGKELVTDGFEAWVHGPVSRKVYNSFKDKSVLYADIDYSELQVNDPDADFARLTSSQRNFIIEILDNLSTWTDLDLETATHNEKPWQEARMGYSAGDKCSVLISKDTTLQFYKKELYA